MRRKVIKPNKLLQVTKMFFLIIIIVYFLIYIRWIYPLHNLSKYQNKEWIKTLTENLTLGLNDPAKLYKIKQYEKNIITFWYYFWHFHSDQYTIWNLTHLHNKFSTKGIIRIYYYDFYNKIHNQSSFDIDFTQIKTFIRDNILTIQYKQNYKQEIDMTTDKMTLLVDTTEIKLKLNLTIEDYSTTIPALMPRYMELKSIPDMMETKCPDEWASDNPMIGKIDSGQLNNNIIESGGNFWFDNAAGFNNYFLSSFSWFILLNDEWIVNILIVDTKENMRKKKLDMMTLLYIKDRKNNKILTCGVHTNSIKTFRTLDHLINPKKVDLNYRDIDDYEFNIEMQDFKINMISTPNEISKKSKTIVNDYYNSHDINIESLGEWDKKYYKILEKFLYTEMVTVAKINIVYNNVHSEFSDRVVMDTFECTDKSKSCEIFCENSRNIRSYVVI